MEVTRPVPSDVSDYLGLLRRHWWVVVLLTLAGVGAAAAVSQRQPKVYQAATSVLVQPAGRDTNVVGGRTRGEINLDTEAQLVRSTAVATGAGRLLAAGDPPDDLARQVTVKVPPNTAVLVITYAADSPQAAQQGSHAFAEAYLRNRQDSAVADLEAQIAAVNLKIRQLNATLTQVNRRLAGIRRGSPDRVILDSQRATTIDQINMLASRLNELSTATIGAGKIISAAPLPSGPVKPDPLVNLATGGMAGLLAGAVLAAVRQRFDRRIRQAGEVSRQTGVPVLAQLPQHRSWPPRLPVGWDARRAPAQPPGLFPPHGPGGRTFNRLRNEVLASLSPGDQVLVVAGASRGAAATLVAANLAAALSRAGSEVVLVGAHLPDRMVGPVPLAQLLGVPPVPGLSDVLAGRVGLGEALHRAAREPWLRVITTGSTATAAGLLRNQALRETLRLLRAQADYIVVEAPSTASSADAQSLAGLGDATIIAVELRRTRHPEVVDAAEQLRRIGTPLLGAVVLPRLPAGRTGSDQTGSDPVAPAPAESGPAAGAPAGRGSAGRELTGEPARPQHSGTEPARPEPGAADPAEPVPAHTGTDEPTADGSAPHRPAPPEQPDVPEQPARSDAPTSPAPVGGADGPAAPNRRPSPVRPASPRSGGSDEPTVVLERLDRTT